MISLNKFTLPRIFSIVWVVGTKIMEFDLEGFHWYFSLGTIYNSEPWCFSTTRVFLLYTKLIFNVVCFGLYYPTICSYIGLLINI